MSTYVQAYAGSVDHSLAASARGMWPCIAVAIAVVAFAEPPYCSLHLPSTGPAIRIPAASLGGVLSLQSKLPAYVFPETNLEWLSVYSFLGSSRGRFLPLLCMPIRRLRGRTLLGLSILPSLHCWWLCQVNTQLAAWNGNRNRRLPPSASATRLSRSMMDD